MIGGSTYTGRARIHYALYRACEWMAERLCAAEEFFLARANYGVRAVLADRYAFDPTATQQNIPRDAEYAIGIRKGDSIEELHPGPFEIENEDEPIDLSMPDVRPPGQWLEGWPPK